MHTKGSTVNKRSCCSKSNEVGCIFCFKTSVTPQMWPLILVKILRKKCCFCFNRQENTTFFNYFSSESFIKQSVCDVSVYMHFTKSDQLKLSIKFENKTKPRLIHISFLWPNMSIEAFNWRRARATITVTSPAKNDNFVFAGKCAMGRSCDLHVGRLKV